MSPMNTKEMEPRIKQRYHFAASSFSRMFGVPKVTQEMLDFCLAWAEQTMPAPLDSLTNVDIYFRRLWNMRSLECEKKSNG
jgi:hypothetical protein